MTWEGIEGHDRVAENLRRSLQRGRLASALIFVGPAGIGKFLFARKLAQALLCETFDERQLQSCGSCPACVQVQADTHPDLLVVARPEGKSKIPLELLIGEPENRMREGLCHDIALTPFRQRRKVAIIRDADFLNPEGANCLLKTLEEPPPRSLLILTCSSLESQLPTIRSRCQVLRFAPLSESQVARLLESGPSRGDAEAARRLAALSHGSLERADRMQGEDIAEFRGQLWTYLSQRDGDQVGFARTLNQFVEAAGKEAPLRRERARDVLALAVDFYRQLMRSLVEVPQNGDPQLNRAVSAARNGWRGDAGTATQCVLRCVEAIGHVDRNAHPATLLDGWLDDLASICQRNPTGTAPAP